MIAAQGQGNIWMLYMRTLCAIKGVIWSQSGFRIPIALVQAAKTWFFYEITQKKISFHEFTQKIYDFHASRMDLISRNHADFFSFSRIHAIKNDQSRITQTYRGLIIYKGI